MVAPQSKVKPGVEAVSLSPLGERLAAWLPGPALTTTCLDVEMEKLSRAVCKGDSESPALSGCKVLHRVELIRSVIRRRLSSCLNGEGVRSGGDG